MHVPILFLLFLLICMICDSLNMPWSHRNSCPAQLIFNELHVFRLLSLKLTADCVAPCSHKVINLNRLQPVSYSSFVAPAFFLALVYLLHKILTMSKNTSPDLCPKVTSAVTGTGWWLDYVILLVFPTLTVLWFLQGLWVESHAVTTFHSCLHCLHYCPDWPQTPTQPFSPQ